jgi:hypothetical protein
LVAAERNERVAFTDTEDDPTTLALLSERWGRVLRLIPQRRKRLVTWTEPDGRSMGRWTWESVSPRLEIPHEW